MRSDVPAPPRVPAPLAQALLGAIVGGLYILFLPVVGLAALVVFAALRAWRALTRAVLAIVAMWAQSPVPGESHLTPAERRRAREDRRAI